MQNQPIAPNWLRPRTVPHEVNGEHLEFREVSVESFAALQDLFASITANIMQIRRSPQLDAGQAQETKPDGTHTYTQYPADPTVVAHHDDKRTEAVYAITSNLERSKEKLCKLVIESLGLQMSPVDFLRQCGASTFAQCLEGFFKANEAVFRPFVRTEQLTKWLRGEMTDGTEETVNEVTRSLELLRQTIAETKSTPGSTSPTPSLFSLDEDTTPTSSID